MQKLFQTSRIAFMLIAAALLFTTCKKKLEAEVYSEIIESDFIPTSNDVNSLVGPVYANMRPMIASWHGYWDLEEESADQIITPARPRGWYDGGTYQRMHRHLWTPVQTQPNNLWSRCFTGINTANRVLNQIESGRLPITSGKEKVIAELKTARAFYYYLLCDNHGNVPIVTDFTNTELPKQSTRKEVYDFVVKELLENIPILDPAVDKTTYGRFNRWAAKAVLAKVYLNAGVYTGTAQWDKCIETCNDIIAEATTRGSYALEAKYRDIFKTNNEGSKELVFAIPYDEIFATEQNIHMKALDAVMQQVYNMQTQPWGGNCAVPQFIDTYDPDDQRLKDSWIMGPQYNATTGKEVINYVNTVTSIEISEYNHGYRMGKFEIKMGVKAGLSNDFPMFRYADVLMMKAESLLRTGRADEAATIVSQVRQRNFSSNPAKAIVTGTDLMKGSSYRYGYWENGQISQLQGGGDIPYGRFLDELGWEFTCEAHRRQDLIRFGVFTTKMWFQHKVSSAEKTLFPIPLTEVTKNPNLKQNPGY
ncbi:RagB/SusD family nutrient uptake outer membrane protein [Segetibacter sp. 3557_3]|uniref:RagB/SusD family nutrient uptake outer membrane protein n=1 Tax=Segetibacter sp. 3557_3 TaxID=2547429 RepID=UPI001FB7842E|nr:RagB/SusD family nutrient uptake outer membrane protein [Segetibacter sp. 3557_3]